MKEKDLSIELLKFFAVLIVANSHMDVLYGKYDMFATGGAIGDALFFFVSGFTIFLGRSDRFDNWYKRRIKRIYPSIIAWAGILSFFDCIQLSVRQIIKGGGYWFVSCIMIYYIVLWFVKRYFKDKPLWPFVICILVSLIWYLFEDSKQLFMYGETYFKWIFNFLFMLAGAYIGGGKIELKSKPIKDIVIMAFCVCLYYVILLLAGRNTIAAHLQVVSLFPLMGIVIYAYKLCKVSWVNNLMITNSGLCLRFIAGLCLEAYIVQISIIPMMEKRIGALFPFNLLITFVIIILVAYITRCFSRLFSQIFEKDDMDWKAVVKAV